MNLIIVDDDALVCASLKMILEAGQKITVCATGNDGKTAISLYEKYHPDLLLMDIRMKEMSGLDAAAEILKKDPAAKILFLTTFSDDEYIIKALKIGAKGYLLKQDYESILPAITAVLSGQSVFGSDIVTKLPSLLNQKKNFDYEKAGLTAREYNVMKLIADGQSNKEIAELLFLSEGTVRNYISSILLKLNLRDRTQIAIYYYREDRK